jgi:hypothetical protein
LFRQFLEKRDDRLADLLVFDLGKAALSHLSLGR